MPQLFKAGSDRCVVDAITHAYHEAGDQIGIHPMAYYRIGPKYVTECCKDFALQGGIKLVGRLELHRHATSTSLPNLLGDSSDIADQAEPLVSSHNLEQRHSRIRRPSAEDTVNHRELFLVRNKLGA